MVLVVSLAFVCLFGLFQASIGQAYDEDQGYEALYYAYSAGCSDESLKGWNCSYCLKDQVKDFVPTKIVTKDVEQAYTGYNSVTKLIVLSIRGTVEDDNGFDWFCYDFEYIQSDYTEYDVTDGKVHTGFYAVWGGEDNYKSQLMPDIESLLEQYSGNDCQILVTGHSLGAAVAQIAALTVANHIKDNNIICSLRVITFGSPRWGNEAMKNYFEGLISDSWRITNLHDPVPHVPFQDMGFNILYDHTKTEVWYQHFTKCAPNCDYIQCDGSGEDDNCADSVSILKYFKLKHLLEDHIHYLGINAINCTVKHTPTDDVTSNETTNIMEPLSTTQLVPTTFATTFATTSDLSEIDFSIYISTELFDCLACFIQCDCNGCQDCVFRIFFGCNEFDADQSTRIQNYFISYIVVFVGTVLVLVSTFW